MPRIGMPILKISLSHVGLFFDETLAGPPDNITALGLLAKSFLAVILYGTISE